MHASTQLPVAQILTERVVDDAACSRQKHSTLASALARHRSGQAISNPVLSQRLVCPVDRFAELQQQRDDADRIEVIALGTCRAADRGRRGVAGR
jgi:hypothetical protein